MTIISTIRSGGVSSLHTNFVCMLPTRLPTEWVDQKDFKTDRCFFLNFSFIKKLTFAILMFWNCLKCFYWTSNTFCNQIYWQTSFRATFDIDIRYKGLKPFQINVLHSLPIFLKQFTINIFSEKHLSFSRNMFRLYI